MGTRRAFFVADNNMTFMVEAGNTPEPPVFDERVTLIHRMQTIRYKETGQCHHSCSSTFALLRDRER